MPLAYDDAGSGPPIVLLHAFPFDRRFWNGVTPGFVEAGFRVIAPEFRGFGASGREEAPWSLLDQAAHVVELLDALQLPQANLLGLSMGGYVALALMATQSQRVGRLVLAHTKAAPDSPEGIVGRNQAIETVKTRGVDAFADNMLPKLLAPHTTQAVRDQTRALMNQPAATIINALGAMRDRPDRRAELAHITAPTLLLTGTEDGISTPAENEAMAAAIPHAQVHVSEGAGHLSNLEMPDAFIGAVTNFLRSAR